MNNPTKVRRQSAVLRNLLPILNKEMDINFKKQASRIAYSGEMIFTLFAALVLIPLFISNPKIILMLHSARILGLLTVSILSMYNIYRGYSIPEVNITFYMAQLFILLAISLVSLVVQSKSLSKTSSKIAWLNVVATAGLAFYNIYLIAREAYRYRLGKTASPIDLVFNIMMAMGLSVTSALAIKNTFT